MKTKTLIIAILLSCTVFFACSKKVELGGEVPYKPCLCEEEKPLSGVQFPQGEAYLFKDNIPEQMVSKIQNELLNKSQVVCWIVFDSKTGNAAINIGNLFDILCVGQICNFPDFVKEWNIPQNGLKVNIEGLAYIACWGGLADSIYFNYVLTSLKSK